MPDKPIIGKVWHLSGEELGALRFTSKTPITFVQSKCGKYWSGCLQTEALASTMQLGMAMRNGYDNIYLKVDEKYNSPGWEDARLLLHSGEIRPPDESLPIPPALTPKEMRARRFALLIKE